jgi:hypothetical protein
MRCPASSHSVGNSYACICENGTGALWPSTSFPHSHTLCPCSTQSAAAENKNRSAVSQPEPDTSIIHKAQPGSTPPYVLCTCVCMASVPVCVCVCVRACPHIHAHCVAWSPL